jgi:molybdenum cofactor biosynthesis enzyme
MNEKPINMNKKSKVSKGNSGSFAKISGIKARKKNEMDIPEMKDI